MKKYDKEYYVRKLVELEVRDYSGKQVKKSADLYDAIKSYGVMDVEYFIAITLDGAHRVIKVREISKGILNRTVVHPREVFRPAIADGAAAIIVAHNHPSNQLEASSEDMNLTKRLVDAGDIIGITVLDHLILGRTDYISLCEKGQM